MSSLACVDAEVNESTGSAFLIAFQQHAAAVDFFKPVAERLQVKMKTVRYSILQKVQTLVASILLGCPQTSSINRCSPFPDWVRALLIAIACELPHQRNLPLSRHFASSVWRVICGEDVAISLRTVQRILARHHLKPWRYVSWMHPRDPKFMEKVLAQKRIAPLCTALTAVGRAL